MPHSERQTAFRLPEDLLAWLRKQARREDRTMAAIVRRALENERRDSTAAKTSAGWEQEEALQEHRRQNPGKYAELERQERDYDRD